MLVATCIHDGQQPNCPSTEKCINKVQYIHTKEYYSALKSNGILKKESNKVLVNATRDVTFLVHTSLSDKPFREWSHAQEPFGPGEFTDRVYTSGCLGWGRRVW
jgi:hypothetical protein